MIEIIIDFWFILVSFSLIFIALDIRNTPVSWVQKLGWILVVMYTGPFGLVFYWLSCRGVDANEHAAFTQATWKQSINSEVHCLAGDATGIIIAAIFLSYIDLPRIIELPLEYLAGFICGWIIFQAGMMRSMYSSYKEALTSTFFAESISMNCVMMGMIPTMILLGQILPESMQPSSLHFWFVMGIATLIGGITAYPINYWLVKNKLKHGCMTLTSEKITEPGAESHPGDAHQGKYDDNKITTTQHKIVTLTKSQERKVILGTFTVMLIVTIITLLYASF